MVVDHVSRSLVKKKKLTKKTIMTSSQVSNTLQEVGLSLYRSTVRRIQPKSKYRGFATRCNHSVASKLGRRKK